MSGSHAPSAQAAVAAVAGAASGVVAVVTTNEDAASQIASQSSARAPAASLQTGGGGSGAELAQQPAPASQALRCNQPSESKHQSRPQRQSSIPVAPNTLMSTVNASRQRQPMCAECEKSLPNQIVFDKIESIIRMMQDEHTGLPVKTAKSFMTKIPSVFTGTDLIQWMMKNLKLEDQQEAIHLANLIASHGYIFPIEDHTLSIKNDCTFYRFQTPCLWPSNNTDPENTDYAVYLCKRTMQGKTRLELADYEAENLARLQKMFSRKWEFIFMQAESQAKVDKKRDKLERKVLDSQERAFWDVYRPVPGCVNTTELDIKKVCRLSKSAKRCGECQKIVEPQKQQQQQQQQQLAKAGTLSSALPGASESRQEHSVAGESREKPRPMPVIAPSIEDTCSNKHQQVHLASSESPSPSPGDDAQASAKMDDSCGQDSSTKCEKIETESAGVAPRMMAEPKISETTQASSNSSSSCQVETAEEASEAKLHSNKANLPSSVGSAIGGESSRRTTKTNEPGLETMDENVEREHQQRAEQGEEETADELQKADGSEDDAASREKQVAIREVINQQEPQQQPPPPHSHHHHHHHHHHPHAHPHPHPHHHHHHHHHPHLHSHPHAHHSHHHHHHHRQCPHYQKQQQQLAPKSGTAKQQPDQPAVAGSSRAATTGSVKCQNHNKCSKQRPSGSVDQLTGPTTNASCRRKSECNRMLSMSEVNEDSEARRKAAAEMTKQPGILKSSATKTGAQELELELQKSASSTAEGRVVKPLGERPSSACCSSSSKQADAPAPAPAPAPRDADQETRAQKSQQTSQPNARVASTSAGDNPLSVGQVRAQRKSSLNIGRPASVDQALPKTAATSSRGAGDNHPSFIRKGSVSSPKEHPSAQLQGAQSVCASHLVQVHQAHQAGGALSARPCGNRSGALKPATEVMAAETESHMDDLERELESLRVRLDRGGVKMSKVTQSYLSYFNQWAEYDPFIAQPIPSNPWSSDSTELWDSERQTKDVHFRRVRRWAFSLKELLNDPAGREQFHRFLEKEFSAENLKFWDAVQELKRVHAKDVACRIEAIWTEYLAQDANCPINIDSKSYETSKKNMAKNKNNRYIFDEAAGHVYQLMKNDSYPRYLRSDMYKDYKEASERRRPNQVAFDVFKPQITTLKHKFNF